jgi:hypothetical protein
VAEADPTHGSARLAIYRHLPEGAAIPRVEWPVPYRALLIVERKVGTHWMDRVSEWLASSGCRFALAWGPDSSAWDSAIDAAWLELSLSREEEGPQVFMTTWHDDEPLSEVMVFAKNHATLDEVELRATVLLDVVARPREQEILCRYAEA